MSVRVPPMSAEQWTDVATIGALGVLFTVMLILELKRTWRWERLGVALTIITACLAFSYDLLLADVFVTVELWQPPVRWATRTALIGASLLTIIVLKYDDPEDRE